MCVNVNVRVRVCACGAEQQVFGMHLTDRDKLKSKFDEIDDDKSGYIESSELRQALVAAGLQPTDDQLKQLIAKYDADNNNKIDFDECVHTHTACHASSTCICPRNVVNLANRDAWAIVHVHAWLTCDVTVSCSVFVICE